MSASNSIQLGDPLVTQIFAGASTNTKFITGIVQIRGGSPGVGKVLTSDDLGNATWQTPAGGGGNSPWIPLNYILSYSGNAHVTGNFQVGGSLTTDSLSVSQFNSIGNIAVNQNFSVNGTSQFAGDANFGTLRAGIVEATEFRSAGVGSPFNFINATISETLSVANPGNTVTRKL